MERTSAHCPTHLAATIILATLAFAGMARAGMAVGELDQSYTNVTDSNTLVAARFEVAQTFTVGRTGTLEAVAVRIGRLSALDSDQITLDLRRTVNGVPIEANTGPEILASLAKPAVDIPPANGLQGTFVRFDLPRLRVKKGDVLAVVLTTPAGAVFGATDDIPFIWSMDENGTYSGGRGFARGSSADSITWGTGSNGSSPLPASDYAFQTYLVPLPSALGMFLITVPIAWAGAARIRKLAK